MDQPQNLMVISILFLSSLLAGWPADAPAAADEAREWVFADPNNATTSLSDLDREKNRTIEKVERDIKRYEERTREYNQRNASKSAELLTNLTQGARQNILQRLKNDLTSIVNRSQIKDVAARYCVNQGCQNGTNFHLATRYEFATSLAQLNDTLHQAKDKAVRFGPAGTAAIQAAETNLTTFKAFLNGSLADPRPYSNQTKDQLRLQTRAVSKAIRELKNAFDPANDLEKLRAQIKPILLQRTRKATEVYRNMTRNDVTRGILLNATPILTALDRMEARMVAAINAEVDGANSTARLNRLRQGFCDNSCNAGILALHRDAIHGFGLRAQQLAEFQPYAAQENLTVQTVQVQIVVAEAMAFVEAAGAYAYDYNPAAPERNGENRPARNESRSQWIENKSKQIDNDMRDILPSMRAYWQERFAEKKAQAIARITTDEQRVQNKTQTYNDSKNPLTQALVNAVLSRAQAEIIAPLKRDTQAATTSAQVQTARRIYCLEYGCLTGLNFHLAILISQARTEAEVKQAENDTARFPNRVKVSQARTALNEAAVLINALGATQSYPAENAVRDKLALAKRLALEARQDPRPSPNQPWPNRPAGNNTANGTTFGEALNLSQRLQNASYYGQLERACEERTGSDASACCTRSVRAMRSDGGRVNESGTCPSGQEIVAGNCTGAYSWCRPIPTPTPTPRPATGRFDPEAFAAFLQQRLVADSNGSYPACEFTCVQIKQRVESMLCSFASKPSENPLYVALNTTDQARCKQAAPRVGFNCYYQGPVENRCGYGRNERTGCEQGAFWIEFNQRRFQQLTGLTVEEYAFVNFAAFKDNKNEGTCQANASITPNVTPA